MYILFIKQFFRSKVVWLTFGIIMLLGGLSIVTGKQFLNQKQAAIEHTITQQQKHLDTQLQLHNDDLGLLMYYLKFSFVNPLHALAGISIGQSDLNPHIQHIGILNLEGQKYDTDFVNPMRLQVGNLDFSFLIVYLFPLVVIALCFNILSQEMEQGTWRMVTIQAKSPIRYLLMKFSVRVLFVFVVVALLFVLAKFVLNIPMTTAFMHTITVSYVYLIFWFTLCLFVILFNKSSRTNAIVLLVSWLLLVVFIPVAINDYIIHKYPVDEAFTMTIKQRDGYHKKWDTDKRETMEKFYAHYPQFTKYGVKEEGFSWLWYYAMQQMGDDDSETERNAMYAKIHKREELSKQFAHFFPPLQVQLAMNAISETSLSHHIDFLQATTEFHEALRLDFYPMIFENQKAVTVPWKKYSTQFFTTKKNHFSILTSISSILILVVMMIGVMVFRVC